MPSDFTIQEMHLLEVSQSHLKCRISELSLVYVCWDWGSVNLDLFHGQGPQHDILFDDLTSSEHIELFSCMKGIPDYLVRHLSLLMTDF